MQSCPATLLAGSPPALGPLFRRVALSFCARHYFSQKKNARPVDLVYRVGAYLHQMSETNKYEGHTPGPWRLDGPAMGFCNVRRATNDEMVFALAAPGPTFGDREYSAEEKEANAALIADAPELLRQRDALLAALERIKKHAADVCEWAKLGTLCHGDTYDLRKAITESEQAIAATKGGA